MENERKEKERRKTKERIKETLIGEEKKSWIKATNERGVSRYEQRN